MNIELLKKVRTAIADEATAFDMRYWGVGISERGKWWPIDEADGLGDCGSPACLAGWAIKLGRQQKVRVDDAWGTRHNPSTVANRLLQLDGAQWGNDCWDARRTGHSLFHWSNWPLWARELSEKEGALAILDLIIAGHNPWEPPADWELPT